ncbi:homoserine kinase [Leptotrichia sp. OH3620_COT-345]|uniref:homoserine kinase n=1 Tax=Leptotrichia sp. OH3620_COT-345 TaxID=2491048 RepID=UPI000F646068|nr:homoserine kinase [Leptotrichia sp. OH3620_COT-345]RRD40987.1 homoserine kinase [Leptotrichia sp. OH3620_COT-345]
MSLKFKVKVPGTSANIGVGYDCLGVALEYILELEIEESDKIEFLENGSLFSIPIEKNLIFEAIKYTEKHLEKNIPSYKVNIKKNEIPMARGLGSSSSAIVAGILIANKFAGNPMDINQIAKLAVEMEGHPDNVIPAIFGGMVLTAYDKENLVYSSLENSNDLYFYVMIPDFQLSTERARSVLPESYLVSDAINNMSKLGLLVDAFNKGKYENLRFLLDDKIHQPYRFRLINSCEKIFEASKKYGALGEYISGAGPTLVSLNYNNDKFLENMKKVLETLPNKWKIEKKKINFKGAEIID